MTAPTAAILFDMDGVLVDSERLHYRAYSEVMAEFGVSVTPEVYSHRFIALGTGPQWAVPHFGLPITPQEMKARKLPILHRLLRDEVELMPGIPAALERLSARFPLAVATNSPQADLHLVVDRFDIRSFFTALCGRESYDAAKPAPDAYLAAAAALGVPIQRCVVVEDAYKGIEAGHAAGAQVIAVPHEFTRGHDFSNADRIVDGADDLTVELVEELVGGGGA